MNALTLTSWMRVSAEAGRSSDSGHAKRSEDWALEERLLALHKSHELVDEALNAWRRGQGPVCASSRGMARGFCAVVGPIADARTAWK
jgi:hypothetical protein